MTQTISGTINTIQYLSSGNTPAVINTGAVLTKGLKGVGATVWTIDNSGFVSGNNYGMYLTSGGQVTNEAGATITATSTINGIAINDVNVSLTLTNLGVISGRNGVSGKAGLVSNASGGVIAASGGIGIYLHTAASTVINAGSITGATGINLYHGGQATNQSGGVILAGGNAITGGKDAAISVVNAGTLSASGAGTYNNRYGTGIAVLQAGGSVTNQSSGVIYGHFWGIQGFGGNTTIVNFGTIVGVQQSLVFAKDTTLTNAGSIGGGGAAFTAGFNNRLIIDPGATFGATFNGGNANGATTVSVIELASGASTGTLAGLRTNFTNFAQTTVDAGASWVLTGTNGFNSGSTLTNAGTLALNGAFTFATGSTFTNTGTVAFNATPTIASGALTNNGAIIDNTTLTLSALTGTGSVTIGSGATLITTGTVAAGEKVAFQNGSGTLRITPGTGNFAGEIDGMVFGDTIALTGVTNASGIRLVNGNTLEVTRSSGGNIDFTLDPTQVQANNFEFTKVGSDTLIDRYPLSSNFTGSYASSLSIHAANPNPFTVATTARLAQGLYAGGATTWTATNAGVIGSATSGVAARLINGSLTNLSGGTIAASGVNSDGVVVPTLTNAGLISGYFGAIANVITNQSGGTIVGTLRGASAFYNGSINNLSGGTISATTLQGVVLSHGTLTNAGRISGPTGVYFNEYFNAQQVASIVTNASSGYITGTSYGIKAVYHNFYGYDTSVYDRSTIVNAGTIKATGTAGVGVFMDVPFGTLTNQSSATISGTAIGVNLFATNTLVNYGVISGAIGINAADGETILTGGSISGTTDAVLFAAGTLANRLILKPGVQITGTVDGGNTIGATGVSTLELASAASVGTLSGLGTQFVDFARTAVDTGAQWTLTGGETVVAGSTLTNSGTLTIASGSLINAGTINNSGTLAVNSPLNNTGVLINSGRLNTRSITVTNNGSVINSGTMYFSGGAFAGSGTWTNNGVILDHGAHGTIAAVLGTGTVEVYGGNRLQITGTVAATETVTFLGTTGRLYASPTGFSGTIDGLNHRDAIFLTGVADATGVRLLSGNTLEVTSTSLGHIDLRLDPGQNFTGVPFYLSTYNGNAAVSLAKPGVFSGTYAGGITLKYQSDNPATITSTAVASGFFGIGGYGGNWTVDNAGTVTGTNTAVYLQQEVLTNEATGTISGASQGIVSSVSGTVTNAGRIIGGNNGVNVSSGSVTNQAGGTITGTAGYGVVIGGSAGSVVNAGQISGGFGVSLYTGGSLINQAGGTVTGVTRGIRGGNATGPLTVVNAGLIQGTGAASGGVELLGSGGSVSNQSTGTLTGVNYGVRAVGPTTINNQGTIVPIGTAGHYGIVMGTGSVTNGTSGLISGSGTGGSGTGIGASGAVAINNQGTITGRIGVAEGAGGATITNAGLISGSYRAAYFHAGGNNRLIVNPGASFVGAVFANANAGFTNTLELASGASTGTLTGITSNFTNFTQTTIDASASWTVTGNNSFGSTATINNAGALTLSGNDTLASGAILNNTGTLALGATTLTDNGTVTNTGTVIVAGGAVAGTRGLVNSGVVLDTTSATFSALTGTGTVSIAAGATLITTGTVSAGQTIGFETITGTIKLTPGTGNFAGQINGFATGDTIDLAGVTDATGVALLAGNTLEVTRSGHAAIDLRLDPTFNFAAGTFNVSTAGSDAILTDTNVPCFAQDTLIDTPAGEVAVQDLRAGDLVSTASGGIQTVRWIGSRRIDIARHPVARQVQPIRIRPDAIAAGMPVRDLWVSPDHALFLENLLIPARMLVNGTTVTREEDWQAVTYYHVELDAHDILLADGLPAESYLDTGNRSMFANAGSAMDLHPDMTNDQARREGESCHPFASDVERVQPIWQRLADRAETMGYQRPEAPVTTVEPNLRLQVGDRQIAPIAVKGGRFTFVLPARSGPVRLVSRDVMPADLLPWLDDRRQLGVMVSRVTVTRGGEMETIPMDHPSLTAGWWDLERDGYHMTRWTNGDAELPVWGDRPGVLEVDVCATQNYFLPAMKADQASLRAAG